MLFILQVYLTAFGVGLCVVAKYNLVTFWLYNTIVFWQVTKRISVFPSFLIGSYYITEHGRRAGDEEMTEIRVVSGETNLILHMETYQL